MGSRGNSAIAGDDRRRQGNGCKPVWIQSLGVLSIIGSPPPTLEGGDNLVNMQHVIKLNSYNASISNTSTRGWLTKLLLVRHRNEEPIHHRGRGEWTPLRLQKLYKLALMKSSDLQLRSGAENEVGAPEMAGLWTPCWNGGSV